MITIHRFAEFAGCVCLYFTWVQTYKGVCEFIQFQIDWILQAAQKKFDFESCIQTLNCIFTHWKVSLVGLVAEILPNTGAWDLTDTGIFFFRNVLTPT